MNSRTVIGNGRGRPSLDCLPLGKQHTHIISIVYSKIYFEKVVPFRVPSPLVGHGCRAGERVDFQSFEENWWNNIFYYEERYESIYKKDYGAGMEFAPCFLKGSIFHEEVAPAAAARYWLWIWNAFFAFNYDLKHINYRNKAKMHLSMLALPSPLEPALYYAPTGLYLGPSAFQQPFYFLDFAPSFNYQLIPQSGPLFSYLEVPSPSQQCSSFAPHVLQKLEPPLSSLPTQNGKSTLEISRESETEKACVREGSELKDPQLAGSALSKCGNDRFIKKNTESNVVNQIFSFLWTPEKSRQFLLKILPDCEKVDVFYQVMRLIKASCRSQLSRHYLKQLMSREEWESGFKKLKKKLKRIEHISTHQVCLCVKKLVLLYGRSISRFSIMTSKKMNQKLWKLHFGKCREILSFLFAAEQQ